MKRTGSFCGAFVAFREVSLREASRGPPWRNLTQDADAKPEHYKVWELACEEELPKVQREASFDQETIPSQRCGRMVWDGFLSKEEADPLLPDCMALGCFRKGAKAEVRE
eukprot:s196_g5.t1